jgi:ketosteroid isomerase-like protein
MKTIQSVWEWMEAFAQAVRTRDYTAGQELFSEDVVSFGTYSHRLIDLQDLVENQWEPIWSTTRNFQFHQETIHCEIVGDLAWVASSWQSEGRLPNDECHLRVGRATLILRWQDDGWKAIHSHFSLQPRLVIGNTAE